MEQQNPQASIVVVQRERFSTTRRSLQSLLEHTDQKYPIIYVDNASPPDIHHFLAQQASEHGFQLIRKDLYVAPAHARNSVIPLINTEYVAFIDNDVLFSADWLESLLNCALNNHADVVTPLILQGELEERVIHTAGGSVGIHSGVDGPELREIQRFLGKSITDVAAELKEEPTQMAEFHCVLIRTEFLRKLGGLDENYLATSEHLDFALTLQKENGSMWFAPTSVVSYVYPPPVTRQDRKYFCLRWSQEWTQHSESHLFRKWQVKPYDRVLRFTVKHRRKAFASLHKAVSNIAGTRFANLIVKLMDWWYAKTSKRLESENTKTLLRTGS